ncbi:GNAT family N-acetyltransferase [Pseudooceanicola sediminis]|uniref:GNAT family N-acetyltransferase n=1 Tax=Pseudooceanicola sediminis TaxID=2211117 RepID=A0A399J337_9RHOB|nr:GNAT family N-acetyltransferase [Pseudooceanicola sediminis]KAA2314306.1 GNAT family N-acetyltransferase [Puniceibacterium sp. HSS470]RII39838.1 GNAT family N-acetyltransferase [Pseudooceanicola sediminis]|tara:strand:+ start:23368 stop:24225 length:858 start_codon:yes stop_codon:yes gene_type:complete
MIRTAQPQDLHMLLDWAAEEGWNPGLGDAQAFHAADPGGFFIAERAGAPVAGIAVINHNPRQAFLGLYLCRPEWRGRGVGFSLWQHAVAHAGMRSIGLDGVAAQQENYARSGFLRQGATQRFEGRFEGHFEGSGGGAPPGEQPTRQGIRPLAAGEIKAMIALDAAAGGVPRPAFLSGWLGRSSVRRTVVRDDLGGFATIRQCRNGVKIGPVIAPNAAAAMMLIRAACAELPGAPVTVDLPEANEGLRALLLAAGFVMTFETARMYRGAPPEGDARMQAIATMELG